MSPAKTEIPSLGGVNNSGGLFGKAGIASRGRAEGRSHVSSAARGTRGLTLLLGLGLDELARLISTRLGTKRLSGRSKPWFDGEKGHMELGDLITPEAVIPTLTAKSKKQVLQDLAEQAAELTGLGARGMFETLLQRERVGSTAVGRGIAIPHGQVAGLERILSVFARLHPAIDFEAPDEEPVDLVFLLLVPEHAGADHLKALARVSRLLRQPQSAERLRIAQDRATIYSILTEPAAMEPV